MTRRCFIAIDIESDEIRSQLADIVDRITHHGEMRPVPTENFHITMNFLGDVKEDDIDMIKSDIREPLAQMSCGKEHVEIGEIGVFPEKSYIKVVWAGVLDGSSYLEDLHTTVTERLPEEYIDEHDFTPHITLARVSEMTDEGKTELHRILNQYENTVFFRKKIQAIKLKESVLHGNTPSYRTIEEYKL